MMRIVDITDRAMVRALSHPIRRRVLSALRERAASPSELAAELGERLGTVSYHVRQLASAGLIELVEERPRRGATEHFYVVTGRTSISNDIWSDLPGRARNALMASWLTQVGGEAARALSNPSGPPSEVILTHATLRLDTKAAEKLAALASELYDTALELEAEAQARLARSGGSPSRLTLVAMLFPAAPSNVPGSP